VINALAVSAQTAQRLPLCRHCHREMQLLIVTPHVRYINLEETRFVCSCGGTMNVLAERRADQQFGKSTPNTGTLIATAT
jgi:hypothetical protein